MNPLRQRFIDDMRLRNLSPRAIEAYVHRAAKFAKHFGRSPEHLGPDHIREYQLHLISQQASWSQFNQTVCALRFLYNTTLQRPHIVEHLPFAKRPRILPTVLCREEVGLLLAGALPRRDRTLLETTYSCGLRLRELLALKVTDYTHRVAISNSRLVGLEAGRVSFEYKDYGDDHKRKTMTLDAAEFLRRFVPHVLPGGFVKMRHYGLLSNRFREQRLADCRQLLAVANVLAACRMATADEAAKSDEPVRERCCAKCGSRQLGCWPVQRLPMAPSAAPGSDTS